MYNKRDQKSLVSAYTRIYEMNLGPAGEGIQPVGKPVILSMDLPGATPQLGDDYEQAEEHNDEPETVAMDLHKIIKSATGLQQIIGQQEDVEGWMIAKIAKAADYISSVYNVIEFKSQHNCCCDSEERSEDVDMFSVGYEDIKPF